MKLTVLPLQDNDGKALRHESASKPKKLFPYLLCGAVSTKETLSLINVRNGFFFLLLKPSWLETFLQCRLLASTNQCFLPQPTNAFRLNQSMFLTSTNQCFSPQPTNASRLDQPMLLASTNLCFLPQPTNVSYLNQPMLFASTNQCFLPQPTNVSYLNQPMLFASTNAGFSPQPTNASRLNQCRLLASTNASRPNQPMLLASTNAGFSPQPTDLRCRPQASRVRAQRTGLCCCIPAGESWMVRNVSKAILMTYHVTLRTWMTGGDLASNRCLN